MRIIKLKVYWYTIHIRCWIEIPCHSQFYHFHSSSQFDLPWIVDHQLLKESLEQLNFLSLWKLNQILSQNIVCFWSVDVTTSKLTLSHADTSLMSSSMVKLFPRWPLLVVDFFAMGGVDYPISTWGGDWWTFTFECGVDIKMLLPKDSKPCSLSCKMSRKKGFHESIT